MTSRTTLPGYSFTYNLKQLNDEDATTLLHHSASLQDGSSHISVEVIKKVRCKCDTYGCNVPFYLHFLPFGKVSIYVMHMNEEIHSSLGVD